MQRPAVRRDAATAHARLEIGEHDRVPGRNQRRNRFCERVPGRNLRRNLFYLCVILRPDLRRGGSAQLEAGIPVELEAETPIAPCPGPASTLRGCW